MMTAVMPQNNDGRLASEASAGARRASDGASPASAGATVAWGGAASGVSDESGGSDTRSSYRISTSRAETGGVTVGDALGDKSPAARALFAVRGPDRNRGRLAAATIDRHIGR